MKRNTKRCENLVYAFVSPIMVFGAWNDPPQQIREHIRLDRLSQILEHEDYKVFREVATETETLWYLSSASMEFPLGHEWFKVFMYLSKRWHRKFKDQEMPAFLREEPDELDSYHLRHVMAPLQNWIRKKQMQYVKGKVKFPTMKEYQKSKQMSLF